MTPPVPQLHLHRFGQGPQPALLLHCALGHGGAWAALAEALSDRWAAVAPDLPGHGQSPGWDGSGDLHDLTTRLAAPLLGPAPADLAGHSFGGTVALRLALEHPGRVRRLILIEPVFFAAARAEGAAALAAHDAGRAALAGALAAGDPEAAARGFLAVWGAGSPFDALPEGARRAIAARMALIRAAEPALEDDRNGLLAPGRLEGLRLPVLLVEGSASPPVIGAVNAALVRRIPGARRAVVPGAGHMAPLTHPAATAAAIRAFLDAADAAEAGRP